MPKLSIHTATYNRAYILDQAYESLKAQSCKEFEWIITDDGSMDSTAKLVKEWQRQDNGFEIIYNPLSHVGIPRALNSGVEIASADWFMMLDSDDYLKSDAVEKIIKWIKEIEDNKEYVGIGFARCFPDGKYMKDQIPIIEKTLGYVDATNIERSKYKLDMDMCEVNRTALLIKYPFQVWPTEMYAPEQLNYNEIALAGYKYRWRDDKLYICEYLPDGQTRDDKLVKRNPMGFAMMHNQNMRIKKRFLEKCRCASYMTALCIYAGNISYLRKSNCMAATIITFPLGFLFGLRRKKQFSQMT